MRLLDALIYRTHRTWADESGRSCASNKCEGGADFGCYITAICGNFIDPGVFLDKSSYSSITNVR